MRIPRHERKLTDHDFGNRPELDQPLKEFSFSKNVRRLFQFMFGASWMEFMTVRYMIRKFVHVDQNAQCFVLRSKGLMFIDEDKCPTAKKAFYSAWRTVLPEIKERLQELKFLS